MPRPRDPIRRRQLTRIHVLARQLALSDDDYRAMLQSIGNVRSAADLDDNGRRRVLDHLHAKVRTTRDHPGRPHNLAGNDRGPQLRKIEALLADAGRPWAYVHGMTRRMFKKERLEFLTPAELRKLIAALEYDRRRRESRA